ncbi:MAG: hypothetical protein ACLUI3_10050 [Christensenellales bacterium]
MVDSGGQGLLTVLKGWRAAFNTAKDRGYLRQRRQRGDLQVEDDHDSMEEVKFKYCTEFIISI